MLCKQTIRLTNLIRVTMDPSCSHSGMFGEPGAGVHAFRVFGLAAVDVVGTIGLALLLSTLTRCSFPLGCLIAFSLGIAAHRLFCVRTTIDRLLFR